jgi:hypothetical protein
MRKIGQFRRNASFSVAWETLRNNAKSGSSCMPRNFAATTIGPSQARESLRAGRGKSSARLAGPAFKR